MSPQERIVKTFNVKIAENKLKQKEIAKEAGISEDRFSRILSSKSKMLADEFLILCNILNINPNDFKYSAAQQKNTN